MSKVSEPEWNVKDSEGLGRYLAGLYYNSRSETIEFLETLLLNSSIAKIMCMVFYFLTKFQEDCIDLEFDYRLLSFMDNVIAKMTIPMVHKVHILDLRDFQKKKCVPE